MAEPTPASAAPPGAATTPLWTFQPERHSGPLVARLFSRSLALVCLAAWASLAVQLPTLVGERGLLPAGETVARMRAAGVNPLEAPSLFWAVQGDAVLGAGAVLGVLLAVLALVGLWPRLCFALTAPLYLSYAEICGSFTAFQWDNMLVETTLLAALLPLNRPAPRAHLALRLLLFKLYLESGVAKWQSYLRDWHDGSAMTHYFETAPIPTRLAWYAHQLPEGLLHLASWGALVLELLVPFFVFGPRRARLFACVAFTGFQVVNTLTANYGFFAYVSLTLHLFLLADGDVARARSALGRWVPGLRPRPPTASWTLPARPPGRRLAANGLLVAYAAASLVGALMHFSGSRQVQASLGELHALYRPYRVVNVYHLFGHITRRRIEPELQTRGDGGWTAHHLRFKPGPVDRPPPFVAPHQPRVDFRLWFYGLSFRRGTPRYVAALLERMCDDPAAVQSLFERPLPASPQAVRIVFYRYRFTDWAERRRSGAYWRRQPVGETRPIECPGGRSP